MYGGAWSPDGSTIVFAQRFDGLFSVPRPEAGDGSGESGRPIGGGASVPGVPARRAAFRLSQLAVERGVARLSRLERAARRLFNTASQVEYVAPGYLVFVRRGTLMAQRFDAPKHQARGRGCADRGRIRCGTSGYGSPFATSSSGALVYRRDPLNVLTQLTWVDRSGRRLGMVGQPRPLSKPRVVSRRQQRGHGSPSMPQSSAADIWRLEFERGIMTP